VSKKKKQDGLKGNLNKCKEALWRGGDKSKKGAKKGGVAQPTSSRGKLSSAEDPTKIKRPKGGKDRGKKTPGKASNVRKQED